MPYMSYCRFEGTYEELGSCISDITGDVELSEREEKYAKRLRDLCEEYIQAYDEWEYFKENNDSQNDEDED